MKGLTSHLWFDRDAEEAVKLYTSIIKGSSIGRKTRYGKEGFEIHGMPEGLVMTVEFTLAGQSFMAINGGPHFKFNESFSIMVNCETQDEIDYYWEKLSANGGEKGQCGWLKDKFGLSWQVSPIILGEMMHDPDQKKVDRVVKAFMQMTKFDIEALKRAYEGK